MRVVQANVGARGVDSLPFSQGGTVEQAYALRASGVDFLVGYLGAINRERVQSVLLAGLGFMPVTFGGAYDGAAAVAQCRGLGLPAGVTVWLDMEGQHTYHMPVGELMGKVNTWADAVASAGYVPGLYVGVPQPLTSDELWHLRVARYWRGQGSIRDRNNALAEPACGWCMTQMWPQHHRAGVFVDVDIVGQDYHSRVPSWAADDDDDTQPEIRLDLLGTDPPPPIEGGVVYALPDPPTRTLPNFDDEDDPPKAA